ncbi:DUF4123 domain-containing protein [Pseudomonas sp. PB120]|uniref:DUF4123 domain-containing protein n=1 Tax=Pseudomonas sp. PB120 TaxID=2494700 RepID=UPI0012FE6B68|nr:DUF4123 domain-containing protein [Pseudomonas sp. PB120]MVV52165.1 DUF4123 domain-containing protein [Pseudomonas sp. PB120]
MIDSLPHQWMTEQRRLGHELCLVLDSENERDTRQLLLKTSHFDQYQSVYVRTLVTDLTDSGPFVFRLDQPNDPRIEDLLANPQRNWGWLASVRKGELPQLVKHWQERLIMGVRPHQALYRFHDNRVLARALKHLPADAYPAYLGPAINVCYWNAPHWNITISPAPGIYPVPDAPLWLRTPVPDSQATEIRLLNAHRYLLAEQVTAYAKLADAQDPDNWLRDRLALAEAWGWHEPEQVEFLLTQGLQAPAYTLAPYWQARANENPAEHFERVHREAQFWQGVEPL